MNLTLEGQILTPIVRKRPEFRLFGCQIRITKIRRRYFTKITASKPMYPYAYICYLGKIIISYVCKTETQAMRKLQTLMEIEAIGRFQSEGMGYIQWLKGSLKATFSNGSDTPGNTQRTYRKVKIRQGLPHNLSPAVEEVIQLGILHDFFQTSKHRSKIYVEPPITDQILRERCQQHHDHTDDPVIEKFRKYDHLSALITRKHRSPRLSRYNWKSSRKINFKQLAQEIAEVSTSVYKLYRYIYESKDLELLNESLEFGHSSLRQHLLILINLIVNDYQKEVF